MSEDVLAKRDLSFLEENGVTCHKKTRRGLLLMEEPEFLTYKLRVVVSNCCRTQDVTRGAEVYRLAKDMGTKGNGGIFSSLLNLLCGPGEPGSGSKRRRQDAEQVTDIDTAFMVFQDLKDSGVTPTESCYTALIRCLSLAQRCDEALLLLAELQERKLMPRLRSFSPLLLALSKERRIEDVFAVFKQLSEKHALPPGEGDYVAVLSVCVAQDDDRFTDILNMFMEDVLVPLPSSRDVILQWFKMGARKSAGYCVRECAVSGGGVVSDAADAQLRSISLQADQRDALLSQIERLAKERDRDGKQWAAFEAFLAKQMALPVGQGGGKNESRRIDTVIDGANIGFFKANYDGAPTHVSFNQIDWVARQCQRDGLHPLIVLHSRHVGGNIPKDYVDMVQRWRDEGMLYTTPHGANDDWFWMYIAVYLDLPHVVSNDLMRDHHFLLLSPRWFGRWRERHQVNFGLGHWRTKEGGLHGERSRQVLLEKPLSYSYRLQTFEVHGAPAFFVPKFVNKTDGDEDESGGGGGMDADTKRRAAREDDVVKEGDDLPPTEQGRDKWWCAFVSQSQAK